VSCNTRNLEKNRKPSVFLSRRSLIASLLISIATFLALPDLGNLVAHPVGDPEEREGQTLNITANPKVVVEPNLASIPDLMRLVQPSMVQISQRGRDGTGESLGAGFVIEPGGLVVTCLHVIGEGRPITLRTADGQELKIEGIHAYDRTVDLAILRVAENDLPALRLGVALEIPEGTEVVAIGNPLGLINSIVRGVISGRRELEGQPMLQIALPIEPGNSGGPLLDREGRVLGIVQAKSLITRNLGFAIPVERLIHLLDKPSPVPLARWLRLGALPTDTWRIEGGANWHQRGGRILVDGAGTGFGGRSLLWYAAAEDGVKLNEIQQNDLDEDPPWEVQVDVRIDTKDGAAGLVFGGNSQGYHYGFYPTSGRIRMTAFEGSDVLNWRILNTIDVPEYAPSDWNRLSVKVYPEETRCYINDTEVYRSTDRQIRGGRVGLVKFRNTRAEFRNFYSGPIRVQEAPIPAQIRLALGWTGDLTPALGPDEEAWMKKNAAVSRRSLHQRARELERAAATMREVATRLHRESIQEKLKEMLSEPDDEMDLLHASLLVAHHDQPDLSPESYLKQFARLTVELREQLKSKADSEEPIDVLRRFFEESGFHGSRFDYQHPSNSYLSEVLDEREGLPITLSIVFMELARQVGFTRLQGVSLPGHFVVRYIPENGDPILMDPFHGARLLTHAEADQLGSAAAGYPVRSEFLPATLKRDILVRLITNLLRFTEDARGAASALPYADLLVAIASDPSSEARHRIERSRLRWTSGDTTGIREDLGWVLDQEPPGVDLKRIADAWESLDPQR